MTKYHAEFNLNFMQNLLIYRQLGVVPKLEGVRRVLGKCKNINNTDN